MQLQTYKPTTVYKPSTQQNCHICPHAKTKCWVKGISEKNVVINYLVCRIQIGYKRDESTKALLELFKPGMISIISFIRKVVKNNVDFDQMLSDMQSTTIELILNKYSIGEPNPITPFLFNQDRGHLVKWARWYVSKQQKYYDKHKDLESCVKKFIESQTDLPPEFKKVLDDNYMELLA